MHRFQDFAKRPTRIDLRRPAVMIDSDGRRSDVVVLDVSSAGFRLQLTDVLRNGERVTLRIDHEELPGEIRWTLGNEAGGIFLTPAEGFEGEKRDGG